MAQTQRRRLFERSIVKPAIADSFRKLDPRLQAKNPVMFVVLVGAVLVTGLLIRDLGRTRDVLFNLQIALWLWFTLLFANFAEAMADGRGTAQAAALKRGRTEAVARRITKREKNRSPPPSFEKEIASSSRPAKSFPETERSSKGSRRWTSPQSRASPPRSSASRAEIARR